MIKQSCKVNCVSSDVKDVDTELPQGSSLGPLLFLLYIDDLPRAPKKIEANIHADDTMMSSSSKTLDELKMVLNAGIVDIEKSFQGNGPSLNFVKRMQLQ